MSISLLTILLFALVSPLIIDFTIFHDKQSNIYYGVVFGLLLLMAVFDIYKDKFKWITNVRTFTVFAIIALTIGIGCVVYVFDRHKISSAYRTHDIIIQQEIAVRMLLTGKNPYKETYFGTALEEFKYYDNQTNPALYHFVMEPFYLVSVVPFYAAQSKTVGFFDARIPLYLLFGILLIGGFMFIKDKEEKLLFITLMTFNPMTVRFLLEGRSDMFMLPFLFGGFIFLYKKRYSFAIILIALAFAIKQTAWPLFPLLFYFLWLQTKDIKQVGKYLLIFVITFGIFVLPFLLWNPKAFLDSTVFFVSGNSANSVPISGYGFSVLLMNMGVIKDSHERYPFIVWQIIFAIPVLLILARRLRENTTVKFLIIAYTIFLAVFWHFSRYFNDSHIGFISSLLIIAYFFPAEKMKLKKSR
ncbi:DUF2029 domain-containing protein [Candidatus Dojkabacteria bacterium]|uniref:DUF2029 domain-containing protein n=1 Tax=Candidatus Dojkabacteria bacterium TaxID=2099670 RepID=A0A5C7JAZ2_9BACT|nr:MAG: DUF2029 domain-containing protein [Candidatus Dojkabacteria bacterium]